MDNVDLKQIKRTFSGGYSINFPQCFNNIRDFKTKNYSNFYLGDNVLFSDGFEVNNDKLKSTNILTSLKYGSEYLQFTESSQMSYKYADRYKERINYGEATFTLYPSNNTEFNLELGDNNSCRIYFFLDYRKYYLVCDVNNKLSFAVEKLIPKTGAINPHDFEYLYSETGNDIVFFKQLPTGTFVVLKYGNTLKIQPNIAGFINEPFQLSRNIFQHPHISQNTSFITYTNDNNVDTNNSTFNLHNNILFHRSSQSSILNAIVLKNQLLQNDVFSCSNNLISGGISPLLVDNLRDYTIISEDIKEETTDELELNYVFYNQAYKISPGYNVFVSPSSLSPFSNININDTKFVSSGAFSFQTPMYADKVYHLSDEKMFNGQYLLCTWLSGSPTSIDKVWVDRYYYPDLIAKEDALAGYNAPLPTYTDYIEQLIKNNTELSDTLVVQQYFDKKSDLVFAPNETYVYERLHNTLYSSLSSSINYCSSYSATKPTNYFKTINDSSQFSVGFYFSGDISSWLMESGRNGIDCGLKIEKSNQTLTFTYRILDISTNLFTEISNTTTIKNLKNNFVFVSVDAVNGRGYFMLNDEIILNFTLPPYQFIHKQLLFGDFMVYQNNTQTNLLSIKGNITDPFIQNEYIDSSISFIKPMLDGKSEIDDIYITLPCGMRNGIDNIEYLQNACGAAMFKSNSINISVKNLNITTDTIISSLSSNLMANVQQYLPVNTNIHNLQFENYR